MKRLGWWFFIGLVFILTGTLALVGMNPIEAKGGRALSWQVAVPEDLGIVNLAGFSQQYQDGYAIFEDQGPRGSVWVVFSGGARVEGQPTYHFSLLIDPGTSGYGVKIGGVTLDDFEITEGEIPDCFPDREECSDEPSMECFLNGAHPYANYDFGIQVGTLDDVENLEIYGDQGIYDVAWGRIHLDMWDTGDEFGDFHRLHCESDPRVIPIKRTGTDEWTISNGVNTLLHCEEYYVVAVPRSGKKGGDARVKYEERVVMTADTVATFAFETIWTRK